MSVRYTYFPNENLVVERFVGTIGVHAIIEVFAAEIADGIREPGLRGLCDFRRARPDFTVEQLHELTEWMLDHREHLEGSKWASLVPDGAPIDVYVAVAQRALPTMESQFAAFHTPVEACSWLGVSTIDPFDVGPTPFKPTRPWIDQRAPK